MKRHQLRSCIVTNIPETCSMERYETFLRQCVEGGGVSMVQLREKNNNMLEVKKKALHLRELLKPYGIPLILNDYVELAAEIEAEGVHVGRNDMGLADALKILGPNKWIGVSIEDLSQLDVINELDGQIYVTASAVFPSKTKPNCEKIWGLKGLKEIVKRSKHPVTAIGGIKLHNIHEIFRTGAEGVAYVGLLHDATQPESVSREIKTTLDQL